MYVRLSEFAPVGVCAKRSEQGQIANDRQSRHDNSRRRGVKNRELKAMRARRIARTLLYLVLNTLDSLAKANLSVATFAEVIFADEVLVPRHALEQRPNFIRGTRIDHQVAHCCFGLIARYKRVFNSWSLVSLPRKCYDHIPETASATRLAMKNTTYGSLLPSLSAAGSSSHPRS